MVVEMGQQDLYNRIVESLHEDALGANSWPASAALIAAAVGAKGISVTFGRGRSAQDVEIYFAHLYKGGQRREDLERVYCNEYRPRDERRPAREATARQSPCLRHATSHRGGEEDVCNVQRVESAC